MAQPNSGLPREGAGTWQPHQGPAPVGIPVQEVSLPRNEGAFSVPVVRTVDCRKPLREGRMAGAFSARLCQCSSPQKKCAPIKVLR